jgi:cell division protein FtsN
MEGFKAENLAANVAPGSPGFYVTAGVFSTKENATKLQGGLKNKGIPSELFQDKGNSMYYVYILKFKSYEEAEAVKSNRLNGRFDGKLWVKIIE